MSYSSECFSTAAVIETNMQQIEDNFDALRNHFANSTAPTSPDAGQFWYDTGSSAIKIRYNSSWVDFWDMDGQCVAAGQVKTASLAAGALSTDAAGRAKMANGFLKSSHVEDVDVTKITNLNKNLVIFTAPNMWVGNGNSTGTYVDIGSATAANIGRMYLPNAGAHKLKASFWSGSGGAANVSITVGSCTVNMGSLGTSTYLDSSTYIDVTPFLGTMQTLRVSLSAGIALQEITVYLTT